MIAKEKNKSLETGRREKVNKYGKCNLANQVPGQTIQCDAAMQLK